MIKIRITGQGTLEEIKAALHKLADLIDGPGEYEDSTLYTEVRRGSLKHADYASSGLALDFRDLNTTDI